MGLKYPTKFLLVLVLVLAISALSFGALERDDCTPGQACSSGDCAVGQHCKGFAFAGDGNCECLPDYEYDCQSSDCPGCSDDCYNNGLAYCKCVSDSRDGVNRAKV